MRARLLTTALAFAASSAWWAGPRPAAAQDETLQLQAPAVESDPSQEGVEVLTRGPVHEAFAEPIVYRSKEDEGTQTLVVDKEAPAPIEELPPEQKPEGENVIWIPGYWAWDDDRSDFLWVSGVWRAAPPNQEWVPGYWSPVDGGGYTWIAGFWASAALEELAYLPEPPASLEEGPTSEPPSENHIWVPGVWRYQETRYVWRPGYYTVAQPDWVWIPAHYTYCRGGYVYVDGYWDYPLVRRGVLFAPVYFTQPVYRRPAYYYSPSIVINTGILTVHLFSRPRYQHYYFGDYYGAQYANFGIRPWYSVQRSRYAYDPIFAYYSWRHGRNDRDWYRNLERRYDYFSRNERSRPAHTYAALRQRGRGDVNIRDIDINNTDITNITNVNVATTLNQFVSNRSGDRDRDRQSLRFERVDNDRREQYRNRARDLQKFAEKRRTVEREAREVAANTDTPAADRGSQRRSLSLADRPRTRDRNPRAGENTAEAPPARPEPEQTAGRRGSDRADRARGNARDTAATERAETGRNERGRDRSSRTRDAATAAGDAARNDAATAAQDARRNAQNRADRARDAAATTGNDNLPSNAAAGGRRNRDRGQAGAGTAQSIDRARDVPATDPLTGNASDNPRPSTQRSLDRQRERASTPARTGTGSGSDTLRSFDRRPGANAAGGNARSMQLNRQPLDPGATRPSPEDLRNQRSSDVRGEDDFEGGRTFATDRENRVARPGRDDRAGARGTTEAGGRRSADRASGAVALPGIRQPRDAGAPNSDLDVLRNRRPSDVRRESADLNEDRRAFERGNRVSRPGRDSRGPGGSAPAPDNPRSRLDLPDRGRSNERARQSTPDSSRARERARAQLTSRNDAARSVERGSAAANRGGDRGRSANRSAERNRSEERRSASSDRGRGSNDREGRERKGRDRDRD